MDGEKGLPSTHLNPDFTSKYHAASTLPDDAMQLTFGKDGISCAKCGGTFEDLLHNHEHSGCSQPSRHPREEVVEPLPPSRDQLSKKGRGRHRNKITKLANCKECKASFTSRSLLLLHIRNVHDNSNKKCAICEESFETKSELSEHVRLHDPEDRIICNECHEQFTCMKYFRTHLKHYPGAHSFKCAECLRIFKSESRLDEHVCTCVNGVPLLCACGESFKLYSDIVAHAKGSNPFHCCVCSTTSGTLVGHIRHVRNHSKQKPYQCETCGAAFSMPNALGYHIKSSHGKEDDNLKCSICCETFASNEEFLNHQITHNERIPCPDCGKMFRASRLAGHRMRHKLAGSLCPHCGKLFDTPVRLSHHLQSAHKNEQVVCTICKKILKTRKIFIEHQKTHLKTAVGTRVAQAICPVCGLELAQKGSLARHILLVHERHKLIRDDKPRLCKECGITLPNKAKYYTHRRQHRAMVERFPCEICSREFNKKQNLVRHMYLLHDSQRIIKEPGFRCEMCFRSFRERKNLVRHYRLVHKLDMSVEHQGKQNNEFEEKYIIDIEYDDRELK